jgi:hypothetical protein
MSLPPHGSERQCPKCGVWWPETRYVRPVTPSAPAWQSTRGMEAHCGLTDPDHYPEHLHLTCRSCGYSGAWATATRAA